MGSDVIDMAYRKGKPCPNQDHDVGHMWRGNERMEEEKVCVEHYGGGECSVSKEEKVSEQGGCGS